jgi:hypothetical protein
MDMQPPRAERSLAVHAPMVNEGSAAMVNEGSAAMVNEGSAAMVNEGFAVGRRP